MISLKNVTKKFASDSIGGVEKIALENISLSIECGDFVVVAGANGAGKSLLAQIIAGLETPTSGKILVLNKDGKNCRAGLIFQDADCQILGETPLEDVSFSAKNFLKSTKQKFSRQEFQKKCDQIAKAVLKKVGLEKKAESPARFLSGGEKRRLAVAAILALDREIIIFDEPYANLDFEGVLSVNSILRQLKSEGKTIILMTHELEKCLALANRFCVLSDGKKVFDGEAEKALSLDLKKWKIKNPLETTKIFSDLVW